MKLENYLTFLEKNGIPISDLNPGSTEKALSVENALKAIDKISNSGVPILGGDILVVNDHGALKYVHQVLGKEYHYLSWSCDKEEVEDNIEYSRRSYKTAKEKILESKEIANKNNTECYVILVI